MEIIDKDKWAEYKKGYRIERLFVFPLLAPPILISEGYWYLALLVLAFTIFLYYKDDTYKLAKKLVIGFEYKYFSFVGLMVLCGSLNWLYPERDSLILWFLLSILFSFAGCYFVVVLKVKKHLAEHFISDDI